MFDSFLFFPSGYTGRKEGGLGCLECSLFKNCRPGLVVHPLEGVVPVAGAERNSLGIFSLRWCAGGQMAQKGQKTTNCEHFAAMPDKTLLIRPSQSLPLVALLLSDFAHAVLVDENVGETAGEHDSEQLDHGQDGAGDGEYRQDRNDVILQHFSAAHFQVGSQRLWFIPVRCTPLLRCNRGRGSS